jgi:hypothetical protein
MPADEHFHTESGYTKERIWQIRVLAGISNEGSNPLKIKA